MALNPLSSHVALSRLRAFLVRARRFVLDQTPVVRAFLALIVLAGFGSIFYLAGQPFTPVARPFLASGRSFTQDELLRVRKALDLRVDYVIDSQKRIQVSPDQYENASALLAKLDLGGSSVEELRNEAVDPDLLASEQDKQRRELLSQKKILETKLNGLPGVASTYVNIIQSGPSTSLRRAQKVSAFVEVHTKNDAPLPFRTVEAIQKYLVYNVANLSPDAVTLMDSNGETYLEPGNKNLQATSRDRALEEQLRQEILTRLDRIKGIRVSVQVAPSKPPATADAQPQQVKPERTVEVAAPSSPMGQADRKGTWTPSNRPGVAPPRTVVAVNQPLPETTQSETVEPRTKGEQSDSPEPVPPAPVVAAPQASLALHGRIGIEVPLSFYRRRSLPENSGEEEPTRDELKRSIARIEAEIKETVRMMVPGAHDSWEIRVESFPDELPVARGPANAPVTESRRQILGWEVIGVAVTLIVAGSISFMLRYGRRPEIRTAAQTGTRRFHRETQGGPAPSERVRELVRRNPQAAASVLQRWVGQGGDVA